jgi:hypothetical protein
MNLKSFSSFLELEFEFKQKLLFNTQDCSNTRHWLVGQWPCEVPRGLDRVKIGDVVLKLTAGGGWGRRRRWSAPVDARVCCLQQGRLGEPSASFTANLWPLELGRWWRKATAGIGIGCRDATAHNGARREHREIQRLTRSTHGLMARWEVVRVAGIDSSGHREDELDEDAPRCFSSVPRTGEATRGQRWWHRNG